MRLVASLIAVAALALVAGCGGADKGDDWNAKQDRFDRQMDARLDDSREQIREIREQIHGDAAIPDATDPVDPWPRYAEQAFYSECSIDGCGCILRGLETEYPGVDGLMAAPTDTRSMVRIVNKYGCAK